MTLALDPIELRILGCLIEKERATPQNYPLTTNSLRLACNQSTNRHPVVDYTDHDIEATVSGLKEQGLLRFVYSTSNRATKYRHVLDEAWGLDDASLAVLCVLFLRGPQTVGEIKGRSDRLHRFDDLADVQVTLDQLAVREPDPLVVRLDRQPGQKDARYVHLLGEPPADEPSVPVASSDLTQHRPDDGDRVPGPGSARAGWPTRVDELEAEVRHLRDEVTQLRRDVDALRVELGG